MPTIVRSHAVSESESAYPEPFSLEKLSFGRDLGGAAGTRALGVWRERLPPGRRTSFTHAHLREEELVYVLSGEVVVRTVAAGEVSEAPMVAGDLVAFPAGTGEAHTVWNRSAADAELLVVGERRGGERTFYPEDGPFFAWRQEVAPERIWPGGPDPEARPPVARLETARLVIRGWEPTDAPDLWRAEKTNQAHLARWFASSREERSVDQTLARILTWRRALESGGDAPYGLWEGRKIVGSVFLIDRVGPHGREIGYWVAEASEGKGYITEAVRAMHVVGFQILGLDRLEICCDPLNLRSAAVARRLGYRHEATLPRRGLDADGAFKDLMVWGRYRADTAEQPGVRAFDLMGRRLV